jgi:MFS family permease
VRAWLRSGPLRSPQFRWYYTGQTTSSFGSAMTPVALAFAVLQVNNGEHLLGFVLAAEIIPNVLFVLIGGSMADRYRRDTLIRLANLGAGVSQAGVAAVVLTGASPYLIFPLAVVNGVLGAFTSPAMRGIIPEIVPRADLRQANSLMSTSRSAAKIVGPTVAGILVATVGGGWGIGIDAASYLIAALCMTRVTVPSKPTVRSESLISQMREGWSYFRRRRWIWTVTAACTLMNLVQMGVWQVLGPIIAHNTFGSAQWGLTMTVKAVGVLIASLVMLRFAFRRPVRDGLICAAAAGVPMIILGQAWAVPYLMVAAGVAGFGATAFGVAWDTSLQQGVPEGKLSRVCAWDNFGSYIAIPVGQLAVIPLADVFGFDAVATVGGISFVVVALLPLLVRGVRRMTAADIKALNPDNAPPAPVPAQIPAEVQS